ncbi:MAG: biotin--[acetyl-CoA-carboxylase] ligase [Eubacterium sp.]|nr:biotin--[acetyl-CoA-carboxylase] ligase [Eubacterium sp.]
MQPLNVSRHTLLHFDELPSTNTYIKEHLNELSDRTAVIADLQTAGRGRRGNSWAADRGMLALSVLYKGLDDPIFMTVISAVAVCRAFEEVSKLSFGIKWTNDIICDERKVCGILCESAIKCSQNKNQPFVICGMGLNVNQTAEFFEQADLYHAASLYSLSGEKNDKLALAEYVLKYLDELLDTDKETVLEEYRRRCVTLGREVTLIRSGETIKAFAKSININGALICENENGEFTVNAGEVRVRAANGEYI